MRCSSLLFFEFFFPKSFYFEPLLFTCYDLIVYRGQAEKEFRVEVEAIGKVRHKNLAGLLGYCSEGVHR